VGKWQSGKVGRSVGVAVFALGCASRCLVAVATYLRLRLRFEDSARCCGGAVGGRGQGAVFREDSVAVTEREGNGREEAQEGERGAWSRKHGA